jgi:hypothetical protein
MRSLHTPLLLVGLLLASRVAAQPPTAGEWLADCSAYLAVLEGREGDDLDIAHCTGLTRGILAGLDTGARLGAVSMGSTLTVLAGLNPDRVLAVLREQDQARLLRYCLPQDLRMADILPVVADFVRAAPAHASRPAPAAVYEALLGAFPCPDTDAAGPPLPSGE